MLSTQQHKANSLLIYIFMPNLNEYLNKLKEEDNYEGIKGK